MDGSVKKNRKFQYFVLMNEIAAESIFYPQSRSDWRRWLADHHDRRELVWLKLYKKASGQFSLPYDDLVEECLCWGWIDGVVKKLDADSRVQRITPRRPKSFLSELNRQRVWKLRHLGLMTPFGEAALAEKLGAPNDPLVIHEFVLQGLQADPNVWATFQSFHIFYQKLKVGWIIETGLTPSRMAESQKRLDYLIKNAAAGKRYGTYPLEGLEEIILGNQPS